MSYGMFLWNTTQVQRHHNKPKSNPRIGWWESDRVFGGLGKELGAGSASWVAACRLLLNSTLLPVPPLASTLVSTFSGWDQPY